jgi:pfkB family carbohydrate kinase
MERYYPAPVTIFTLGTACGDTVMDVKDGLTQLFDSATRTYDGKTSSSHTYKQSGGGAINTRLDAEAVGEALGKKVFIYTCAKFGPPPEDDDAVLRMVMRETKNKGIGDPSIIDMAYGDANYRMSESVVLLNEYKLAKSDPDFGEREKNIGRAVLRVREEVNTPINQTVMPSIANAVANSHIAILHSKYPEETLFAAQNAKMAGVPILFDCSEKNPEIVKKLEPIARLADYVVCPADAMLPGMEVPDPEELMRRLILLGCKNIAISDNNKPIRVYTKGRMQEPIHIRPAKEVDVLGAGDCRDAALGYFLATGDDFVTALTKASDIASFSIEHYGRDWTKKLAEYVKNNPLYANRPETPAFIPVTQPAVDYASYA